MKFVYLERQVCTGLTASLDEFLSYQQQRM